MAEIPKLLNQKSAQRVLEDHGYTKTIGGKHVVKMEKAGCRPITLPRHHGRNYSTDLTKRILREARIK